MRQVIEQLDSLPENLQRQVLEFVVSLRSRTRQGGAGRQLLAWRGQFQNKICSLCAKRLTTDANRWT